MISHLQIRNFRNNRKLDVKLSRITVFRGPSGAGKSSLIGALKWVTSNIPSGTNFINWNANFAAVRLKVNSHTILRKRSKKENYYKLDGQKLAAFGTGVPDSIKSILDTTPLNFQRQHAGPFWFRETAGEVSRQLNSIVNLELIDKTLANLDKEQRETKTRRKIAQEGIKAARANKGRLRFVLALDRRLGGLERQEKEYLDRIERENRLTDLIQEAYRHKENVCVRIPNIKPLLKLQKKLEEFEQKRSRLSELFGRAEEYEEAIVQLGFEIDHNEKELKKLMGKRCPLCGNPLRKNSLEK